jgi:hypothetical protein
MICPLVETVVRISSVRYHLTATRTTSPLLVERREEGSQPSWPPDGISGESLLPQPIAARSKRAASASTVQRMVGFLL